MLFHITMVHSADNCPVYEKQMMPELLASFENLENVGQELGVTLHNFTVCGPNHVFYALVEADTLTAVSRFVFSLAIKQDINIVPVEHLKDTIAMARAAAGISS
jgi:hypothetical protein